MVETILQRIYRAVTGVLVYQEPESPSRFVLEEHKPDDSVPEQDDKHTPLAARQRELAALLNAARWLANVMADAQTALTENDAQRLREAASELRNLESRQRELSPIVLAYETGKPDPGKRLISASLTENVALIEDLYGMPENKDIIMRQFEISGAQPRKALLVYLDGMVDKQLLNLTVIEPLMYYCRLREAPPEQLLNVLAHEYLPANQANQVQVLDELANAVNSGDTALLVEGVPAALVIDSKGYKQRSVERPQNEQTVRGSQVAFSEGLRVNTGLMHSVLQTSDLVTEIIMVGKRIPQKCALMYLRSLANPLLVAEARRRLNGISTDFVLNAGVLEQFIEDHPNIPLPQTVSTERPDRVAASLVEGRLALFVEGNPFANVFPISLFNFFHSPEDWSLKPFLANQLRLLRWTGTLVALILPSLYIAISYFHQEAMPTELVLAVAAARENVPFPAILEVLMMEFAFELIREAGWRVPSPLGATIGIVGAIILGQAAVSANLVSPIMVVIIAITGLASFVIPEYRMAAGIRVLRFVFLLMAMTMGLSGLGMGMLILTVFLCSMKSFGVPYLAPVSPKTIADYDVVLRGAVYARTNRQDALSPLDTNRQPPVSRRWAKKPPVRKEPKR